MSLARPFAPTVCLFIGAFTAPAESSVHVAATFVPPDEIRLTWPTTPGKSYQVSSATAVPGEWTVHATDPAALVATGEELSVSVASDEAVRFFRVVVVAEKPQPAPGMVWIPPGTFMMGSPDSEPGAYGEEWPRTQVTLTRGFWLGRHEVTQREYLELMGANPSRFTGDLDRPVEQVSWLNATAYTQQLTLREQAAGRLPEGWRYQLPSEAQWEYACRAGTTTRFSFGDALGCTVFCGSCAEVDPHVVWCGSNDGQTAPVGSRLPNPWGLYDMHGNVGEWCADWFEYGYAGGSVTDPKGAAEATGFRVIRGNGWTTDVQNLRSASRGRNFPTKTHWTLGFRLALAQEP